MCFVVDPILISIMYLQPTYTQSCLKITLNYLLAFIPQVYVACKTCPSCQQPFPKTGPIAVIMSEYEGLFRRRTERIKREKPNYYDASAFNNRKNPKKVCKKLFYK